MLYLAHCFITGLHTDVKAFLTVPIVRFGQYIVDVMENIALVKELMI